MYVYLCVCPECFDDVNWPNALQFSQFPNQTRGSLHVIRVHSIASDSDKVLFIPFISGRGKDSL